MAGIARETRSGGVGRAVIAARVPPHAYFFVSAIFHYLGPAFAVLLFAHVSVVGVAWLRIASAATVFAHPLLLLAGIGVGVCSSVIPYVCDQLAMARLPRSTFALLLSLLPASATVIGVVVLAQMPGPAEIAGVALVACGVALHRASGDH